VRRAIRGLAAAIRRRPWLVLGVAAAVVALDVWLPPLVLSIVRKPWTYFTFNPWLTQLPAYLLGSAPLGQKLDFLTRVAVFWFTADGPHGFPEWGFAVDTLDLARFMGMGLLIGLYVALLMDRPARRPGVPRGGAIGAVASVLGVSTGPCSVVGCGAPVLPVVGLAFAGLSSATLAVMSEASRLLTLVVFAALVGSIAYLAWQAGPTEPAER